MNRLYFLSINLFTVALLRFAVYRLLINNNLSLPVVVALISSLANLLFLWLIGRRLFNNKIAYWAGFIYGISPWTAYLEMSGSIYIFLLAIILLVFYLSLRFSFDRTVVLLFSVIIIFVAIPKVTLFSDIGVMNNLNILQGAAKKSPLSSVARFIENKYTYFGQQFTLSVLNSLTPTTYFTSNVKLLGWSFSPPILIGFLIPLLIGIPMYYNRWKKDKITLSIPLLLFLPAAFLIAPDLNRLILFSPFIFYSSAMGIVSLIESNKLHNRIITLIIFGLIIWQYLLVISDILYSEPLRFQHWQQLHE